MTRLLPKRTMRKRQVRRWMIRLRNMFWVFLLGAALGFFLLPMKTKGLSPVLSGMDLIMDAAEGFFSGEPKEVRELRKKEVAESDEGHQEYYFHLLDDDEKRGYREMLEGVRARKKEFYVTIYQDAQVDRVYHALLKDHPELFWIHNREQVFKTTFSDSEYCLFTPGYTYTDEEILQIQESMEAAFQAVSAAVPEGADVYETVKTVYTYLIDHVEYEASEHDQNIAGVFWKNSAVCAGYAGAMQYLLERFDIPCIYVEGSVRGKTEGHAWNIVTIDGENYYVDVTNGDQPQFLIGDAAQLPEHKTTMYDYFCPFPWEYEADYTAAEEFPVPSCTASDKNFYVLNQGCFDTYSWQQIYDYCKMRMNYGAAVVRFKFSNQEAFDAARREWIDGGGLQDAARIYMEIYGLSEVQYHYGILENLKTMYFIF